MFLLKRIALNTFVSVAALAAVLIFTEAVCRLAGWDAPGYVTREDYGNVNLLYQPNSKTRWRGNLGSVREFDTPIQTNSIALHDREHAIEKPSGVYRIIVVGDSYVEALQVPLNQGFPLLLEQALNGDSQNADGRRVEVIKMGASGSGALKAYELVRRHGFRFAPDLVIGFFTDSNDMHDDWHHYRRQTGQETYTFVNARPPDTALDKHRRYRRWLILPWSRLNRWIAFRWAEWRARRAGQKRDAAEWKKNLGIYVRPGAPGFADEAKKWDEAFRLTAAGHLQLRREAAEAGAVYAAVLIDRPATYRPDAAGYLNRLFPALMPYVDWNRPAAALKSVFVRKGIPVLDLNPVFGERWRPGRTGHYRYDGHWDADGHRWTAEALAPFVRELMAAGVRS